MTAEETAITATATVKQPVSWQGRAGARARLAARATADRILRLLRGIAARREASAQWRARDVRRISPFYSPPAAIAELVAYTRSGAWVPGEQAPVLEAAGRAYGWVIAVPVSVALYAVAWVIQRPARCALAAAMSGFLWISQGGGLPW